MAVVFIPKQLESAAGGLSRVEVEGATVRRLLDALAPRHPDLVAALLDEKGALRSNLAVAVDGDVLPEGLRGEVAPDSEVHFIPALSGGRP